jgi:chloramphenicol 3-O-phosphotransferase
MGAAWSGARLCSQPMAAEHVRRPGGVEPPLILLTGPAGAGKTATADAWARWQRRPTLHLSLDDLRDRVKAGYANPEDGPSAAMFEQLALARTGCAQLARLYAGEGFGCVIDDAIFPGEHLAGYAPWVEALAPLRPLLVVLLPSFESVVRRNAPRTGHRRLREATLREIYDLMTPWRTAGVPVIDNTKLTVDEAAAALESVVSGQWNQSRLTADH